MGTDKEVKLAYIAGAVVVLTLFAMVCMPLFLTDYQPRTTYECPCGVEYIVVDEVNHYTESDTITTTIIDVSGCIKK